MPTAAAMVVVAMAASARLYTLYAIGGVEMVAAVGCWRWWRWRRRQWLDVSGELRGRICEPSIILAISKSPPYCK